MKNVAVEFINVTKSFQLRHDRPNSLKSILTNISTLKFDKNRNEVRVLLEKLNFKIFDGEFVGIMGRNGIGKSTLLKLIARIYQPNSGEVRVRGRVAPLLELGAGFANDLTGHENIFLNASILGFSRARVREKIKAIIEFADIGDAIQQPVRSYSSGMLVRLGFSIAAFLDAEILLFDEILAVGDLGFQKRCLEKIGELHSQGKTIILVSHERSQIEQFCRRCIILEKNGVVYDGLPSGGIKNYQDLFFENQV